MFVVHENEGRQRPFGNPHVHVFLSPLTADGKTYYISRTRLARFKARWEREVGRVLDRRERRPFRARDEHTRLRDRLALARSLGQLALGRGEPAIARTLPGPLGRAARLQRDLAEAASAPEQLARRLAINLLARFIPAPMRPTVELVRRFGRLIPRG